MTYHAYSVYSWCRLDLVLSIKPVYWKLKWIRHIPLTAITGTTALVPYYTVQVIATNLKINKPVQVIATNLKINKPMSGWIAATWKMLHYQIIRPSSGRQVYMPWWRHQMEIFSASLALCVGNSPVNSLTQASDAELCFLWSAPEQTVE